MLILDPESTSKWHCNKKSNSPSGCKNETLVNHNCKKLGNKLQPKVQNAHRKFSEFYINFKLAEHL